MKEFDGVSKEVTGAYEKALKRFGAREYVTAVDIGYKYSGGKKTDKTSIRIHVKEKKDETSLEAVEIFPESIDGVPVDVIEATYEAKDYGRVESISDRCARLNTIQPGISVGHFSITAGTLGLVVQDNLSGRPAILSNWHVFCGDSNAQPGDSILQPGPDDGGRLKHDTIAFLERRLLNENGDAAIAVLNDSREWRRQQYDTEVTLTDIRNPRIDDILVKSGRTTGVTYGKVDGFGRYFIPYSVGRVGIDGFKLVARKPDNPDNEEISSGGDSGSCWYDPETHEGVGLHFAGETNPSPRAEHAIACYLSRVFEELNISLLQSA